VGIATKPANKFWLNRIKSEGVRLMVEIDLTFDEFRKMMERPLGYDLSDDDVYALWEVANRRLLPPDESSFSGIGFDVGECVRRDIASPIISMIDDRQLKVGRYTIGRHDDKSVFIQTDDGEGGQFSVESFSKAIAAYYEDHF
jgi:hypothetical protein